MSKRKITTTDISSDEEEAPSHLICPITRLMFKEPVIVTTKTCARTYERVAIIDWIVRGNMVDPLSREPLIDHYITPNESIRIAVSNWLDTHPGLTPEMWSCRDLPPRKTRCLADIHHLAIQGDIRGVDLCIKAGIDVNATCNFSPHQYSALHFAIMRGHLDLLNYLIDAKANVNLKTSDRNTALHLAAAIDNIAIVRALLNAGGDVNCKNMKCNTPLHIAARQDHSSIALELIKSGANPNTVSKDCGTPLHIAVKYNNTETVDVLINHADINRKDHQHSTCLQVAVENGNLDVVKTLLEPCNDLEVNYKNNKGLAAIHIATIEDDIDILNALLDHEKVDADIMSDEGLTPLHMAIIKRSMPLTDALMKRKDHKFFCKTMTEKNTFLHWVFACANSESYSEIFRHIHEPAELFDSNFLKYFLRRLGLILGSKITLTSWINSKNEEGKTALDLCKELHRKQEFEVYGMRCIEVLKNFGADHPDVLIQSS